MAFLSPSALPPFFSIFITRLPVPRTMTLFGQNLSISRFVFRDDYLNPFLVQAAAVVFGISDFNHFAELIRQLQIDFQSALLGFAERLRY